jgi:hypothetical protein
MLLLGDAPPNRVRVVPVLYHVPSLSCKRETPPNISHFERDAQTPNGILRNPILFLGLCIAKLWSLGRTAVALVGLCSCHIPTNRSNAI